MLNAGGRARVNRGDMKEGMMRKDKVGVEGKENVRSMREKAECEGKGLIELNERKAY